MDKIYKITFTPCEPYFFGNEKSFLYPGQSVRGLYANSYFIKGEEMPSQSALLGALRYIFLVHKKADYNYTMDELSDNNAVVGNKSFDIDSPEMQSFGIIKKCSPVFIHKADGTKIIPTPFDHRVKRDDTSEGKGKKSRVYNTTYAPFSEYKDDIETLDGKKLYADDFEVKDGLADSYVALPHENSPGSIYSSSDVFTSDTRIGINRGVKNDGFFKKEYKMLKDGFSFAVYAVLDIDAYACVARDKAIDITKPQTVFLGQGKSAFSVEFTETAEAPENDPFKDVFYSEVKKFLSSHPKKEKLVYCLSDTAVSSDPYENTLFSAVKTKEYRAFKTVVKETDENNKEIRGRVVKGSVLHRLIKAGSVFLTDDPAEWIAAHKNEKAEMIGFNSFIIIGG